MWGAGSDERLRRRAAAGGAQVVWGRRGDEHPWVRTCSVYPESCGVCSAARAFFRSLVSSVLRARAVRLLQARPCLGGGDEDGDAVPGKDGREDGHTQPRRRPLARSVSRASEHLSVARDGQASIIVDGTAMGGKVKVTYDGSGQPRGSAAPDVLHVSVIRLVIWKKTPARRRRRPTAPCLPLWRRSTTRRATRLVLSLSLSLPRSLSDNDDDGDERTTPLWPRNNNARERIRRRRVKVEISNDALKEGSGAASSSFLLLGERNSDSREESRARVRVGGEGKEGKR